MALLRERNPDVSAQVLLSMELRCKEVSFFFHAKIPEAFSSKPWPELREEFTNVVRKVFYFSFMYDSYIWVDVVANKNRGANWCLVFVHMWCESEKSLKRAEQVEKGESFDLQYTAMNRDGSHEIHHTGWRCSRSTSKRRNNLYQCNFTGKIIVGPPKQCRCCGYEYARCPNGGVEY